MRVLCVNDLPPGGASGTEVHLQLLVDGLRGAGDDVEVFSGTPRAGLRRLGELWDPFARRELSRTAGHFRPDVLHVHNVVRELSVAVLGAAPSVPRVLTAHDGRLLGDADGQGRLLRGVQVARAPFDASAVRRHADLVLAVSPALAGRLRRAGFPRVREAAAWATEPVGRLLPPATCTDLAFVGRLDRDKGVDVLVDAFSALQHPTARLLLAGDGARRAALRDSAAARDGRVVLLGTLDRPALSGLLGSTRALVVPSLPARRPEGAPLVAMEALVHGRPLVVSDDPGCVALAGEAGLVVPAGDVPALTAALRQVLADDRLVDRLAAAAAAASAPYREAVGLARVRSAYAEVLG